MVIIPMLLYAGSGTRLWPLSREGYPKQFTDVIRESSLFQASAGRFTRPGFADRLVATSNGSCFIVTEQLESLGITPKGILIEPEGRNTDPAVIASALYAAKVSPDALILLVPSDHAVADPQTFRDAVELGRAPSEKGKIVTSGIPPPSRAETSYRWLEAGGESHPGVHQLTRCIEKPDQPRTEEIFSDLRHLWSPIAFRKP